MDIGLLCFPGVQQLDLTGPFDVFALVPGATVHLVAASLEPVTSATGLILTPTVTFGTCPDLDVVCVPGGGGINALLTDDVVIDFLRQQARGASFVSAVCTGSLVLGAAGLLDGKRATTHWASHHLLERLGAIPVQERVVQDGNVITGGGVTAGIDMALTLVAALVDRATAQFIQLQLEYAPAPPFDTGHPSTAPDAVVDRVRTFSADSIAAREAIIADL